MLSMVARLGDCLLKAIVLKTTHIHISSLIVGLCTFSTERVQY
jgi:hypothetical protein